MTTHRPQLTLILVAVMLTAAATCPAQDGGSGAITIHLFYSPTCAHCHEVRALVGHIAEGHPGVSAVEHTLADPANIELMAQHYLQYGVPEEQWGGTVALFAGDRWWSDAHAILAELDGAVGAMSPEDAAGGVPNVPSPAGGSERLIALFRSFGVVTIAVAGLVDGINPCALATLVFLISYLSLRQRSARDVLATGLLFAAGVFAAYLAIGIGALRVLHALEGISTVSPWLYPVMAAGTFILAVLSFRDAYRVRVANNAGRSAILGRQAPIGSQAGMPDLPPASGRSAILGRQAPIGSQAGMPDLPPASGRSAILGRQVCAHSEPEGARDGGCRARMPDLPMTLVLPPALTRLSHRVVRMTASPAVFLGFAFVAGVAISVLELFCTGQIYLPTLMYVWGEPGLRTQALGLLILYVGMFTLPIVALTLLAYAGTSSQSMVASARRHTASVKLAMGLLFLALTGYLLVVV